MFHFHVQYQLTKQNYFLLIVQCIQFSSYIKQIRVSVGKEENCVSSHKKQVESRLYNSGPWLVYFIYIIKILAQIFTIDTRIFEITVDPSSDLSAMHVIMQLLISKVQLIKLQWVKMLQCLCMYLYIFIWGFSCDNRRLSRCCARHMRVGNGEKKHFPDTKNNLCMPTLHKYQKSCFLELFASVVVPFDSCQNIDVPTIFVKLPVCHNWLLSNQSNVMQR